MRSIVTLAFDAPVLQVEPIVSSLLRRVAADPADTAHAAGRIRQAVLAALTEACASPCAKSRRGAACWSVASFGSDRWSIVAARNAPPPPMRCEGGACRAICTHAAEHAEAAALRQFLRSGWPPTDMLHIKVDLVTGEPVHSAGPSCASCSRSMLAAGVEIVWLWTADGWRGWTAADFHRLALQTDPKIPGTLVPADIDQLFAPRSR